ncbi:hypothetical protein [Polymorphospora lycopeni]|uniref:Uncharacterized protein n=1 Tax=Polymorphospora lycopeni TaxID=3140240 RepID=A0ABV5CTB5_9ACTN
MSEAGAPVDATPAAGMWITTVPMEDADGLNLVLGVDIQGGPGERIVSALLGYGHEGEEGVFYLLPDDLLARCERVGDRVSVRLLAWPTVIERTLRSRDDELAATAAGLPPDEIGDGRVTLLHREIRTDTDFIVGVGPDDMPPVLIIDHVGPATLPELFASFEDGEAGIAVVNAG